MQKMFSSFRHFLANTVLARIISLKGENLNSQICEILDRVWILTNSKNLNSYWLSLSEQKNADQVLRRFRFGSIALIISTVHSGAYLMVVTEVCLRRFISFEGPETYKSVMLFFYNVVLNHDSLCPLSNCIRSLNSD